MDDKTPRVAEEDKTPRVVDVKQFSDDNPADQLVNTPPTETIVDEPEPEIKLERPAKDWSYAQTKTIVQGIMGPLARVRHNKGKDVVFTMEKGDLKIPFGWGDTFFDAVVNTFVKPMRHKATMQAELAKLKETELAEAVAEREADKTPRVAENSPQTEGEPNDKA